MRNVRRCMRNMIDQFDLAVSSGDPELSSVLAEVCAIIRAMQKRTKIVATLGPASEDVKRLRKMIRAGLDVARINFSHGEADEHRARAKALRKAARKEGRDIGLLGDLQGPKIRVKRFRDNSVHLEDGATFFLDSTLGLEDGSIEGVGVALDTMHEDVVPGDTLLLNDGLITLEVESVIRASSTVASSRTTRGSTRRAVDCRPGP